MKKLIFLSVILVSAWGASAQSRSYMALQAKFQGKDDVHSFKFGGFLCRAILRFSDEEILKAMAKDVRQIRFIVIPRHEFESQNLSLSSYKAFVRKDGFEELMTIKEHGDHVFIYRRDNDKDSNRYLMLIEEKRDVVAIEMTGNIDPAIFKNGDNSLTSNR